jgi:hypothetical protein
LNCLKQAKFSNSATSSLSSTAVAVEMSKMAAHAAGNSVSEFQSGFSDRRTDLAARVSFKVRIHILVAPSLKHLSRNWVCRLSEYFCFDLVWVHERSRWRAVLLREWLRSAWRWVPNRLQHMDQHLGSASFQTW